MSFASYLLPQKVENRCRLLDYDLSTKQLWDCCCKITTFSNSSLFLLSVLKGIKDALNGIQRNTSSYQCVGHEGSGSEPDLPETRAHL